MFVHMKENTHKAFSGNMENTNTCEFAEKNTSIVE